MKDATTPLKLIAFYLPQFHPIIENDEWWGKGFTEWTNVTRAFPNFEGHYQPHYPSDLGYYDLRLSEVREEQAALARKYGIYGFCYHHYWFGGKRLLERPFNEVLQYGKPDFPFCLCWANENWTRKWDGAEHSVLIAQQHSPEDDLAFIRDIMPALKDKRYITINGKPVLLVYRVSLLPNPTKTAEIWRKEVMNNGLPGIYLVAAQSFGIGNPGPFGFDAAVEFPPHNAKGSWINDKLKITNPNFSGNIFDYEKVVRNHVKQDLQEVPDYTLFRTVMPSWDNTARRPNAGHIFHNSSPEQYQFWLEKVIEYTSNNHSSSEQLVFINAWNEWAEGCHLEPDRKYGHQYLEATQTAISLSYKKNSQVSASKHNVSRALQPGDIDQARLKFLLITNPETLKPGFAEKVTEKGIYGFIFEHTINQNAKLFSLLTDSKYTRPFCVAINMQEFTTPNNSNFTDSLIALFSHSLYMRKNHCPLLFIRNAGINKESSDIIEKINVETKKQGFKEIYFIWAIEDEFESGLLIRGKDDIPEINHSLYSNFKAIAEIHPEYVHSVNTRNQIQAPSNDELITKHMETIPNLPRRHDTHFRGWYVSTAMHNEKNTDKLAHQLWLARTDSNAGDDYFITGSFNHRSSLNQHIDLSSFLNNLQALFNKDIYDLEAIAKNIKQKPGTGYNFTEAEESPAGNRFIAYYPQGKNTYNKIGDKLRKLYAWSDKKGLKMIPFCFRLIGNILLLLGLRKLGRDFINMKYYI